MVDKKMNHVEFIIDGGAHSDAAWANGYLMPAFKAGVLHEYPGADMYCVCYGELYAYKLGKTYFKDNHDGYGLVPYSGNKILAKWSLGVPDCGGDTKGKPAEFYLVGGVWLT